MSERTFLICYCFTVARQNEDWSPSVDDTDDSDDIYSIYDDFSIGEFKENAPIYDPLDLISHAAPDTHAGHANDHGITEAKRQTPGDNTDDGRLKSNEKIRENLTHTVDTSNKEIDKTETRQDSSAESLSAHTKPLIDTTVPIGHNHKHHKGSGSSSEKLSREINDKVDSVDLNTLKALLNEAIDNHKTRNRLLEQKEKIKTEKIQNKTATEIRVNEPPVIIQNRTADNKIMSTPLLTVKKLSIRKVPNSQSSRKFYKGKLYIQSTLVISTSHTSKNRLSGPCFNMEI